MTREAAAVLLLLVVATVPLICALFLLFRKPYRPVQWLLYWINILLVRLLWRADLPAHLPLPEHQGAVVICNHRSSIDPFFIQAAAGKRLVHWMVAQFYGQHTFIGWLLQLCEIIPVGRRGRDVSPTKAAIRLAAAGEAVGMLPEGTINTTDAFMRPVRPGAVLVALKARVPILPCYLEGTPYHDIPWRPLFMPARVRLKAGDLIDLSDYFGRESDKDLVQRLTLDCAREIAKLAGRDDFQPRLAGRDWKTWQLPDADDR